MAKRKPNISPEVEHFLANEGRLLLSEFFRRYEGGRLSKRGNHYETVKDHSWRSVEQRMYEERGKQKEEMK